MGLYDSENASLDQVNFNCDSEEHRSKLEVQVAFLDQKVDKSAQNVDENSITKISSPESTVEPSLPVSSTCVSDGPPEKVMLCQLVVSY